MSNLFDLIDANSDSLPVANDTWRPEAPPPLDGVKEIFLNVETNGLKWWENDRPIAISVYGGDRSWYLPFRHSGGGNLDEHVVKEWTQRELRGKRITNINTRFDIHMLREWGVDLEAQGNSVSDVGHYVALLDDHRYHMNLDSIIQDYLHETPMQRLDESRMASYSAGAAQARARYNVESVKRLKEILWPELDKQGLQRVRQLEDEFIFVVCEMEKNGGLLDHELLERWIKETLERYNKLKMQLYKDTGLKINPNSNTDVEKLFNKLGIPIEERTALGNASFTDDILKHIQHPHVKLLRKAKKYASLNSKLRKYRNVVDSKGILRYAIHQLRATRNDEEDAGETGTITGRCTSTEIVEGVGTNIQQVLKPEKQLLTFGDEFFVRDLHIPDPGMKHLSADAEQIQYRIFAHEASNPKILQAYKENPYLSFHKMVWAMLKVYKPDLSYRRTKDVNFAKMFLAGMVKIGFMLEYISKKEMEQIRRMKQWDHPKLAPVKEILKIYDQEMPEVKAVSEKAEALAKQRGYIKTILGRRLRYLNDDEARKALNGRIQGSEADYVKTKGVELHKNRKYTGLKLRWQVHDEYDGDVADEEGMRRVDEVLNRQSFPDLKVPIMWKSKIGTSWGDCSREELEQIRAEMHL